MHNQTPNSLSFQFRNLGQAIPELPPEGLQRGGDKTSQMDASTLNSAFRQKAMNRTMAMRRTGGIVRGGDGGRTPPVGILRELTVSAWTVSRSDYYSGWPCKRDPFCATEQSKPSF